MDSESAKPDSPNPAHPPEGSPPRARARQPSKLRDVLDWPTSTVKGAAVTALVVIVATALVETLRSTDKAPTPEMLTAETENYSVQINVDRIRSHSQSLSLLDANEFYVDKDLGYFIRFPDLDNMTLINEVAPSFFQDLSVATMPFFSFTLRPFTEGAVPYAPEAGDIVTARILAGDNIPIAFSPRSRLGTMPFSYNPLSDDELAESSVALWLSFQELPRDSRALWDMGTTGVKGRTRDALRAAVDDAIERQIPEGALIHPGITIKSFRKAYLDTSPLVSSMQQYARPSTLTYFFILQMLNPEMATIALNHCTISKDNDVILVDSSFPLAYVEAAGRPREAIEIVKLFLLVNDRRFVHVVRLEYVNGLAERIVEDQMETSFKSFRLAG